MSLAIVYTRAQVGIDAPLVTVEVHLSGGLPSFSIVGLPETAVKESRERVRSALINSGYDFPQRRITVNLAPADLPKEGGRYDLAVAIGILAASGQLPVEPLKSLELIGELALSGELRPVAGVLPVALACREVGRGLFLPLSNGDDATLASGLSVYPASHLLDVCAHLKAEQLINCAVANPRTHTYSAVYPDLNDVKGQLQAKRALEIAAAGSHNLLLVGPPGSGKSMLANRLPGLLPEMTESERLQVASIHSIVQRSGGEGLICQRPFRAPHHTASSVALVGGGGNPKPGEISLAHQGVLFLDELPEFSRKVLEVLREPIESGEILISRAARQSVFPARFQLVTAMNPCPCGYYNDGTERCRCSPDQVRRYQSRVSGPLLDRIDLQLSVQALSQKELMAYPDSEETSEQVRERVILARSEQMERQGYPNQMLEGKQLEQICCISDLDKDMLAKALEKLQLSARAYHRVLRVARTIADLAGAEKVESKHLLEALSYRVSARALLR
ncbi:YifB family Mg chelatase-like AAA ATPase [Neptuniibacter marinus]|uniref:YifB family Mg chelatase-like AAA ATPase n=1 Tax=Neptuniibacter marinus TaxID=1806670 RepID=UPI003B5ABF8E